MSVLFVLLKKKKVETVCRVLWEILLKEEEVLF